MSGSGCILGRFCAHISNVQSFTVEIKIIYKEGGSTLCPLCLFCHELMGGNEKLISLTMPNADDKEVFFFKTKNGKDCFT